ncbi:hypothetical protein [Nocardioides sp.]|uniref:hypothetical protein n=1 Tax=Nocardioides sp. TaxID=35761 RepID=UPI00356958E5
MTRFAIALLACLALSAAPALADDDVVTAEDNDLLVEISVADLGSQGGGQNGDPSGTPIRDSDLDSLCVQTALSVGEDPFEFCDLPPEEAAALITPGVVAVAFQRIPLPASGLEVQPSNGRTLVNFETNFYTEAAPFDRTLTLLGQRVDLHIVPSGFGWRFGDGAEESSTDAGAPYPDLRITHAYQRIGRVQARVDTTYTATFRVNGGEWAAVPGRVSIDGLPVSLEVLSATPVLVGS